MARKLTAISVGFVLIITVFASAPLQAANLDVDVSLRLGVGKAPQKTIIAAQKSESPRRNCGWIGPGGRAIYRCL